MSEQTIHAESARNSTERKKRQVSRYAFPYYDLQTAIGVAKELYDRAGGKASLAQLASYLDHTDETSGAFRAKIWGAKLFGLVKINLNNVSVTPLGEQLASTRTGVQRDIRLAEAFLNVPLFREVYKRYEGSTLPSMREGLKKALQDTFGIPSTVAPVALKTLQISAEQAGFKRENPNRLIHPVPTGLLEREGELKETEGVSIEGKREAGAAIGPQKQTREEMLKLHPLISGIIEELPSNGSSLSKQKKERLKKTFESVLDLLYPTEDQD